MNELETNEKCLKCGEIVTPYGGLLRLDADTVLHMECAMRWRNDMQML
jgi:ribosomal protein S27E